MSKERRNRRSAKQPDNMGKKAKKSGSIFSDEDSFWYCQCKECRLYRPGGRRSCSSHSTTSLNTCDYAQEETCCLHGNKPCEMKGVKVPAESEDNPTYENINMDHSDIGYPPEPTESVHPSSKSKKKKNKKSRSEDSGSRDEGLRQPALAEPLECQYENIDSCLYAASTPSQTSSSTAFSYLSQQDAPTSPFKQKSKVRSSTSGPSQTEKSSVCNDSNCCLHGRQCEVFDAIAAEPPKTDLKSTCSRSVRTACSDGNNEPMNYVSQVFLGSGRNKESEDNTSTIFENEMHSHPFEMDKPKKSKAKSVGTEWNPQTLILNLTLVYPKKK